MLQLLQFSRECATHFFGSLFIQESYWSEHRSTYLKGHHSIFRRTPDSVKTVCDWKAFSMKCNHGITSVAFFGFNLIANVYKKGLDKRVGMTGGWWCLSFMGYWARHIGLSIESALGHWCDECLPSIPLHPPSRKKCLLYIISIQQSPQYWLGFTNFQWGVFIPLVGFTAVLPWFDLLIFTVPC